MNENLISLIPKMDSSETMSQFRPIALCNVVVKLITKITANQIKPLMLKLVGEEQASYVPGHQGIDNMIIVQELIHSMRRKTEKIRSLAIKVDLEKAYNIVDLTFLQHVLKVVRLYDH